MCTVTDRLGSWGARPQEGVARVLGDELFYRKLLQEFSRTRDMELLVFFVKKGAYRDGNGINQFDFYHRTGFSIEKSAKYPLSSGMIFLKMTIYTTMFIFELSYILWY